MKRRPRVVVALVAACAALSLFAVALPSLWHSLPVFVVNSEDGSAVLWEDPGAVETLDMAAGPGGADGMPRPPFTFVEEDLDGTNAKIEVRDANGVRWNAKWGGEVKAELFATRLVWACGYYATPAHLVRSGRIDGVPALERAGRFVGPDGSFADARFERKSEDARSFKDRRSWRYDANPFVGTAQLNGLRVLLMLTSNWDTKDARDVEKFGSNTKLVQNTLADGTIQVRYIVSDWGGTMGKWGAGPDAWSVWDCEGYAAETPGFVRKGADGRLAWGYVGVRTGDITDAVRPSDVAWLLRYLGRLSDDQIRAGLAASGASPDEVVCFSKAIRERVEMLERVAAE